MKVKRKLLLLHLTRRKMTAADLAHAMSVDVSEVDKLLNGDAVGEATIRELVDYWFSR